MGRGHYGKTKMQVFVTGASGFIGGVHRAGKIFQHDQGSEAATL